MTLYSYIREKLWYEPSDYCWPKALWLKPPRIYFLEASCKLHDDWYEEWWNEWRRLVCDLFFYVNMLNDINKLCRWFYKRIFYFCWTTVYFLLVRLFGWTCFVYNNKYDWTNFWAVVHALGAHRSGKSKTFIDFIILIVMSSFTWVMFTFIAFHLFPSATYLLFAMSGTWGYLGVEWMSMVASYLKNKMK